VEHRVGSPDTTPGYSGLNFPLVQPSSVNSFHRRLRVRSVPFFATPPTDAPKGADPGLCDRVVRCGKEVCVRPKPVHLFAGCVQHLERAADLELAHFAADPQHSRDPRADKLRPNSWDNNPGNWSNKKRLIRQTGLSVQRLSKNSETRISNVITRRA
jgi:hypothetical protein